MIRSRAAVSRLLVLFSLAGLGLMAVIVVAAGRGQGHREAGPLTFERDIRPILVTHCALSGCHLGAEAWVGLDLGSESAYESLVGQPSMEAPNLLRVEPLRPDSSYLVHKLVGTQSRGGRMPLKAEPLPRQQIELVIRWIETGAKP